MYNKVLTQLQCTHAIQSQLNPMVEATTTTEHSMEDTDSQQDGNDQSRYEKNSRYSRDFGTYESSQLQTNASNVAMSSQSEFTSPSPRQSPYTDFDLHIVQAKHELMVTLMKEVYAMFDSGWKLNVRTCANSQQGSSGTQAQPSKREAPSLEQNPKRRKKDRDSSPPGDDDGRRKKRKDPDAGLQNQGRPLACPYHKYDPYKYSLNSDTGAAYRSCLVFASTSISHVK